MLGYVKLYLSKILGEIRAYKIINLKPAKGDGLKRASMSPIQVGYLVYCSNIRINFVFVYNIGNSCFILTRYLIE